MALADTAKLVASLELQDKFTRPLGAAGQALTGFERKAGTLGRIGNQVSRGLGTAAHNIGLLGVAAAGFLAANVTAGVQSLEKLELAQAQTEAVLKSTSNVADQSAESIRNLAEKYESLNATIDDKVIQSGENLLLTFTNIRKEAFEPALQAALDMNQAMGGGEQGLHDTIIRLGKALQDPLKGFTALRRVGVNLTETQKQQIKDLIAQNDLYGAQQIILKELGTEFGGSFARAGDTAAGKFAKVRDAVEDAQQALARAFLPVLGKVADKLNTILADPAVLSRIESFGDELAGGFDKLLKVGGSLPWQQIGDAFKIVGTGSKALLDAFLGLPPWVQTAVLTGWGLNKLTGGALGGIAGTITKALVTGTFGARGTTPLNPLFVSQVGGVGGAPTAATGGGTLIGTVAKFVLGPAAAVIIGSEIAAAVNKATIQPAIDFEQQQFKAVVDSADLSKIVNGLDAIDAQLNTSDTSAQVALIASRIPFIGDALGHVAPELEHQRDVLLKQLEQMGLTRAEAVKIVEGIRAQGPAATALAAKVQSLHLPLGIGNALAQGILAQGRLTTQQQQIQTALTSQWGGKLDRIADKPPATVNVRVTTNTSVSVSNVVRTISSYTAAIGSGPGGAVSNPY